MYTSMTSVRVEYILLTKSITDASTPTACLGCTFDFPAFQRWGGGTSSPSSSDYAVGLNLNSVSGNGPDRWQDRPDDTTVHTTKGSVWTRWQAR